VFPVPFQVGDILFVRGDTPIISSVVKSFLHSEFSHVAIAVGSNIICEIDAFKNLKTRPNPYTNFDLYRYKGGLTEEQKDALLEFLDRKMRTTKGYDWDKILEFCIRRFLHWNVFIDERNRYICSEIIDAAYQAIGIDLVGQRVTGDVTPVDLLNSIYLIQVKENERYAG
jgi:hypothetical protein